MHEYRFTASRYYSVPLLLHYWNKKAFLLLYWPQRLLKRAAVRLLKRASLLLLRYSLYYCAGSRPVPPVRKPRDEAMGLKPPYIALSKAVCKQKRLKEYPDTIEILDLRSSMPKWEQVHLLQAIYSCTYFRPYTRVPSGLIHSYLKPSYSSTFRPHTLVP